MRRLLALAVVSGMSWLAVIGSSGTARAVVSGPNGRIAFAREMPKLEDFATFTVDRDDDRRSRYR